MLGAQDIWLLDSTYDEAQDSIIYGITITAAMKSVTWQTSKNFNTPIQLGTYMKNFFANMKWWLLTPRFDDTAWFENDGSYYSVASMDARFAYIANAGLVHANAELFFTNVFKNASYSTEYTQKLARYWVARYAAYPVLWTTAQEVTKITTEPMILRPTLGGSYLMPFINMIPICMDPVIINQDGKHTVSYRSTDNAGNVEEVKSIGLNLDATSPTISVSGLADGTYSDSMDITPILSLSNNLSGMDNSKTTVTLSTDDVQQTVQQGAAISLYTLPLGSHTLIVTASDMAGNTSSQTVVFETTASIQSLQTLVTRFANAGWINSTLVNSLQRKLAANDLVNFVNDVKSQSGKKISAQAAGYLLRDAQYLLAKN